jgi:hypothetical protein
LSENICFFSAVHHLRKEDDLEALRLRLAKEEEVLRMNQQENVQRLQIMKLQHQVNRVEYKIPKNGSEKVQNWLHRDHNSFVIMLDHKSVKELEMDDETNRMQSY